MVSGKKSGFQTLWSSLFELHRCKVQPDVLLSQHVSRTQIVCPGTLDQFWLRFSWSENLRALRLQQSMLYFTGRVEVLMTCVTSERERSMDECQCGLSHRLWVLFSASLSPSEIQTETAISLLLYHPFSSVSPNPLQTFASSYNS